jgi:hypothetical protein
MQPISLPFTCLLNGPFAKKVNRPVRNGCKDHFSFFSTSRGLLILDLFYVTFFFIFWFLTSPGFFGFYVTRSLIYIFGFYVTRSLIFIFWFLRHPVFYFIFCFLDHPVFYFYFLVFNVTRSFICIFVFLSHPVFYFYF